MMSCHQHLSTTLAARLVAVAVVVVVECWRGPQRQELEREQREDWRIQPTVVKHILANAHTAVGREAERMRLREDPTGKSGRVACSVASTESM